jgi:hypothetical protein|tara:strand:- start:73 stop:231 length:159 start_codon:yes stop_codon:yes gene_type:complete
MLALGDVTCGSADSPRDGGGGVCLRCAMPVHENATRMADAEGEDGENQCQAA